MLWRAGEAGVDRDDLPKGGVGAATQLQPVFTAKNVGLVVVNLLIFTF